MAPKCSSSSSTAMVLFLLSALSHYASAQMSCASWSQWCHKNPDGTYEVSVMNKNVGALHSDRFYHYGVFSAKLKFPTKYSGGLIFAYYLIDEITTSNKDPLHSEVDAEFYGNSDPKKIMLATNVFSNSQQNLWQHSLGFNPTDGFHDYTMQWNARTIVWAVDGTAIRVLKRGDGAPEATWPDHPMRLMLTVWDCSSWCSQKANYSNGPITLQIKDIQLKGCSSKSKTWSNTRCTKRRNPTLSWNKPSPASWSVNSSVSTLRKAYNWDKA